MRIKARHKPVRGGRVGCLLGDLSNVVRAIGQRLEDGDVLVWVTPEGDVMVGPAVQAHSIDPDMLCGTYSLGVADAAIYQDLAALRHQRAGGSMMF